MVTLDIIASLSSPSLLSIFKMCSITTPSLVLPALKRSRHLMDRRIYRLGLLLLLIDASSFFTQCEGRKSLKHSSGSQQAMALKQHLVTYSTSDPNSNYLGSPYYLPPYEDAMGPNSSPQENPPYCIYPPLTPFPPTVIPTPILPIQSPPPPLILPIQSPPPPSTSISPPIYTPYPPEFLTPGPPTFEPSPPTFEPSPPGYGPSRPSYEPSPPEFIPGPPEFYPGPPIFLPPVVYPPPTVPPPPHGGTGLGLWCVAKPTVPEPIIQEAMNYACGSGANCDAIQPNGSCFQPDTLIAHASFAFNSYWQRTKVAGGDCDFGGTAILITKDPSYDGCRFNFS